MDDWQDAAFSTRHMHNRVGGGNRSERTGTFNVRKTFGTYSVKCPAQKKIVSATVGTESEQAASLELYRLTENGEGIIGELLLPGVLNATVILAGSRESLRSAVMDIESSDMDVEPKDQRGDDTGDDSKANDSGIPNEDDLVKEHYDAFEKNSFRSPKFWFRWRGTPIAETTQGSTDPIATMSDLGYVVFSRNDCRKFKGTINCEALKWENAALTGHKTVSRSEQDVEVNWA